MLYLLIKGVNNYLNPNKNKPCGTLLSDNWQSVNLNNDKALEKHSIKVSIKIGLEALKITKQFTSQCNIAFSGYLGILNLSN